MLEREFDKVLDITANRRFDQQFAIHQARKSLIEAGVVDLEQEVEAKDSPDGAPRLKPWCLQIPPFAKASEGLSA